MLVIGKSDWTLFRDYTKNPNVPDTVAIWTLLGQHPYLFHSQAILSAEFVRSRASDEGTKQFAALVRLEQQKHCMDEMRIEIERNTDGPSDALIYASLVLGVDFLAAFAEDRPLPHPISPFALSSASHYLCMYNIDSATFSGAMRLVSQRGGIDKIQHPVMY